jgi:DNA-binding SARP family transcriptional activator
VQFGVLGPVRVVVAGRAVRIMSARQRAVLAVLLLSANRAVSTARLVDAVWGEHPAETAQNLVRTYVWRLRALLVEDGEPRLVTEPAAYRLRVEPGELDMAEFERLLAGGKAALTDGNVARAAEDLRVALDLWRGEPFADVALYDGNHAAEVQRLLDARATALEERIEADLALGRHEDLTGELRQLVQQYPLRERLAGQLMLACYRSGRQDEALTAYRQLHAGLVEHLGIDPGAEVADLHQRILRADPDLLGGRAVRRAGERIVPRQLPAVPRHFAGRAAELKALSGLLDRAERPGGTVVISAIDGTGGIGKTTLALHWGRQNVECFPDGQLYVNLRGFAPNVRPVTPSDAVRGFLDALGVAAERVPHDLDARAALYRSMLDGRRMLIVLDNARETDQVRPLLPGSPTCLTLVTSRNPLTGLIAAEAAHPITLDLLTFAEAHELLTRRLGAEVTAADPDATAAVISLCARLPLALGIAAARAAMTPAATLADLAAQLTDVRSRLDVFDIGDTTTDLRAVFTWSYRHLAPDAARGFRLLAVHPGPDITVAAAASLAGVPVAAARRLIDELTRAHLLTEYRPGRFAFHDLLRVYAGETTRAVDSELERREATRRVLDHYLHTAYAAAMLLQPNLSPLPLDSPAPGAVPEDLTGHDDALAWFTAEESVLLGVHAWVSDTGFDRDVQQLAVALYNFLERRGRWADSVGVQEAGLAAARRLGDRAAQAVAHRTLGRAYIRIGSHPEAQEHFDRAIELYRESGNTRGLLRALTDVSWLAELRGRFDQALTHAQQSLELARATADPAGEAYALNAVGWSHALLGDFEQALAACEQAVPLHRDLDTGAGEATTWDSLGYVHLRLAHYGEAVTCYHRALDKFRRLGDRYYEANTLSRLGDVHLAAGDPDAARDSWRQALAILDDLNNPDADELRAKLSSPGANCRG